MAPIDVARVLGRILWEPLPGTASTSATLAVGRNFTPWLSRVGAPRDTGQHLHPSPFDHASQALLALPRDLPPPDHPDFLARTTDRVIEAVELSDGGTFVLCTSYDAVRAYARALDGRGRPVLAQTRDRRGQLLERFRSDPRSVLVGTDAFWEGVSVKGEGLRQVIIPRIPFRVPTDPLQEAQFERERQRGRDPFRSRALPHAVLRLRQGYGRLLRSTTDRGAVVLLDRRIHERTYGRVILHALPPARRVVGPWRRISEALRAFFTPR